MKAYVLHAVGDLRYDEVEVPECRDGWVIVQIKAAGICSSDIPRIFTNGTYHFPTIPGHEFCGVVVKAGSEKDKHFVGNKVGVFPLIPCKKCSQCKEKHYETCENYDYLGSRRDGGFAEYVEVPTWNLIKLPDNISYEEAAMFEPLAVSLHATKQAGIKKGDSVAIIGDGAIGFAIALWAKKFGASKICVVGIDERKKAIADKLGVELVARDIENYDVAIEAVGAISSIQRAISAVKAGGRIVLMGNPYGDITLNQNVYWRILRKQLSIVGTWNSSYECGESCDWTEVRDSLANGEINVKPLITHVFNQTELKDVLNFMRSGKEPYAKVMTVWNR